LEGVLTLGVGMSFYRRILTFDLKKKKKGQILVIENKILQILLLNNLNTSNKMHLTHPFIG